MRGSKHTIQSCLMMLLSLATFAANACTCAVCGALLHVVGGAAEKDICLKCSLPCKAGSKPLHFLWIVLCIIARPQHGHLWVLYRPVHSMCSSSAGRKTQVSCRAGVRPYSIRGTPGHAITAIIPHHPIIARSCQHLPTPVCPRLLEMFLGVAAVRNCPRRREAQSG